ncbi:hypothetical protein, partial [Aquabacterium sp.]|uniref:hypothetical protein n=1 Tax=Aquabacterium sp. TaxID=1872578 RepID=UPI003D6D296F
LGQPRPEISAAAAAAAQAAAAATTASTTLMNVGACVPSGKGKDYQVGPLAGQYASLDLVPWQSLAAGDTVRIFNDTTKTTASVYKGKFLLTGVGTATAPIRICGVKTADGKRPIIDAKDAVSKRGLAYGNILHETRSIIVVKPLQTQAWEYVPKYIQIDGLDLQGANPSNKFTDSLGTVRAYEKFGACIWVDRGQNITIADNLIHDCTNGIFTKSAPDGDFAVTKDIRLAGNYIYGNGNAYSESEHNTYVQSVNVVYEFNRFGPLRANAGGNLLKDRSAGTVVRYNRFEEGAHALDLVDATDFAEQAKALPSYRKTYVYGNVIIKNGNTGTLIHYGGDMAGGEANFRKGTLYFFNNTVYATGSGAVQMFQLSTTDERAEVWNNILAWAPSVQYASLRAKQDLDPACIDSKGAACQSGGILNFGKNWINANWADSDPYHVVTGQVTGQANLIKGATLPVDLATMIPLAGSAVIDASTANLSAVSTYTVSNQISSTFQALVRNVNGAAADLGAMER